MTNEESTNVPTTDNREREREEEGGFFKDMVPEGFGYVWNECCACKKIESNKKLFDMALVLKQGYTPVPADRYPELTLMLGSRYCSVDNYIILDEKYILFEIRIPTDVSGPVPNLPMKINR